MQHNHTHRDTWRQSTMITQIYSAFSLIILYSSRRKFNPCCGIKCASSININRNTWLLAKPTKKGHHPSSSSKARDLGETTRTSACKSANSGSSSNCFIRSRSLLMSCSDLTFSRLTTSKCIPIAPIKWAFNKSVAQNAKKETLLDLVASRE